MKWNKVEVGDLDWRPELEDQQEKSEKVWTEPGLRTSHTFMSKHKRKTTHVVVGDQSVGVVLGGKTTTVTATNVFTTCLLKRGPVDHTWYRQGPRPAIEKHRKKDQHQKYLHRNRP